MTQQITLFPDHSPEDRAGETADAATLPPRRVAAATLRLCVLGSGSGGNCSALHDGGRVVLLDAGFGPRTTARRLAQAGLDLADVRAICVTHLDQDHFRPNWVSVMADLGIELFIHRWHIDGFRTIRGADNLDRAGLIRVFNDEPFEPAPGLRATPVRLPHDLKGTTGFLIESPLGRIGYATDLGHVPDELIEHFSSGGGVDLLAIESNYDPQMQIRSDRPIFLKRRIMGKLGHLSNQEAFDAVRRIVERSPSGSPRHIVLLHRSRQCNCPVIVKRVFAQDPSIGRRIALTDQRRRSRWFTLRPRTPAQTSQLKLTFA